MGKTYERLDEKLRDFISSQPVFFVATAPQSGGHVNVSPRGYGDTFAIVDDLDEEQFGPALPILTYRDESEVIDRANATMFGLSGSVWTGDPDRGAEVASKLEAGTVQYRSKV